LCCNMEETKGLQIPVLQNNTEKISVSCLSRGFSREPHIIDRSNDGTIIWVVFSQ
jgi:hypothetical protein